MRQPFHRHLARRLTDGRLLLALALSVAPMAASEAAPPEPLKPTLPEPRPAPPESVRGASAAERETWRKRILQTPRPAKGCYTAAFPDTGWRQVPCKAPPDSLSVPRARGLVRTNTVGGSISKDFAAQVAGHITKAEGSFDGVSGVTSESNGIYSLQLNTDFFSTSTCAGAPDPACRGWEQFVYHSSGVGVMQYWLLNFGPAGTSCPKPRGANCMQGKVSTDGWCPQAISGFSDVLCVVNAPSGVPAPAEPLTSLQQLKLTGTAGSAGTADSLAITDGTNVTVGDGANFFPDLGSQWQIAEFNVFGDSANNPAVTFNAGTRLMVRTSVVSGTSSGPTCQEDSFTAETNNLTLVKTPVALFSDLPSLVFSESNAENSDEVDCGGAISLGDTHLTTFDGLHYDFQAAGDFVLVQSGADFIVQARQASGAPAWPNASVNKGVAIRMGTTRVAFYVEPARVTINGANAIPREGAAIILANGVQIIKHNDLYVVSDDAGDHVRVTLNSSWIDVYVGLGRAPLAQTRGLLGNPAGNASTLTTASGVALKEPVSFTDLYHAYADSWRVPANQSLFSGGTPVTFAIPKAPFVAKDLAPAVAARALATCKAAGVTDANLLEDCKLDTAVLDKTAARVFVRQLPIRRIVRPIVSRAP